MPLFFAVADVGQTLRDESTMRFLRRFVDGGRSTPRKSLRTYRLQEKTKSHQDSKPLRFVVIPHSPLKPQLPISHHHITSHFEPKGASPITKMKPCTTESQSLMGNSDSKLWWLRCFKHIGKLTVFWGGWLVSRPKKWSRNRKKTNVDSFSFDQ